jgi:putative transcriptional regulator
MAKQRKAKTTKTTAGKLNRIKEVLAEQGKTQIWLAEQLDRDFQTVTRYVNNHRQPTLDTIFAIAKVLKVNPRDLINS